MDINSIKVLAWSDFFFFFFGTIHVKIKNLINTQVLDTNNTMKERGNKNYTELNIWNDWKVGVCNFENV